MFQVGALVHAVIVLVILGLVWWLMWWLVNYINPPEPFKKVATVLLAVTAVVIVISILLGLAGYPLIGW